VELRDRPDDEARPDQRERAVRGVFGGFLRLGRQREGQENERRGEQRGI